MTDTNTQINRNTFVGRMLAPFMEIFGLSLRLAMIMMIFVIAVIGFAVFWYFHSAPPRIIRITTGPAGSIFELNAIKYATIISNETKGHIKLKILPSQGALENLQRLNDPRLKVDVGFIQGGITNGTDENGIPTNKLVSLGSIYNQPMLVFYRGSNSVGLLAELGGKRLAVGPIGSGTRTMALSLLQLNGIEAGGTNTFLDMDANDATKALLENRADAVFMMGDSASPAVLRQLLRAPGIQLMDLAQAEGYARRITYLNKMTLPRGAIDFGKDIPTHDVSLIGPTVELIARPTLHPALSDLLMEAAHEVHGPASVFRRQGEFPSLQQHDFPISAEAERYHASGKTFLYSKLPFALAALVNFVLVAFVPVLVVLVPGLKLIPAAYKWRIKLIFYRWYRALLTLEREIIPPLNTEKRNELVSRLDEIEAGVNKMKVPASFAGDFYGLRGHVDFVRAKLEENAQSG